HDPVDSSGFRRPTDGGTHLLWYRSSSTAFVESLPVGNGHCGATLAGLVGGERIQVNEGSAWSGPAGPHPALTAETGPDRLAEIRSLLAAGELRAAEELLTGFHTTHAQAFLPFALVEVQVEGASAGAAEPQVGAGEAEPQVGAGEAEPQVGAGETEPEVGAGGTEPEVGAGGTEPEVERWLDLRTGIAGHRYHRGGTAVAHRSYASHPHSVLVHEIRADAPVDVRVQVARSEEHTSELQSRFDLVCRLLLENKKMNKISRYRQSSKKLTLYLKEST